jgi:hypothetical protein
MERLVTWRANRTTPLHEGAIRTSNPVSSRIGGKGLGGVAAATGGGGRAGGGRPLPCWAAVYCGRWRRRGCVEVRFCGLSWGRHQRPSPWYRGCSVGIEVVGQRGGGGATSATGGGWVVGGAGGAEAGCREEEDRRMRMGMGVVGVARLKKKQGSHDPLTCNPSHIRGTLSTMTQSDEFSLCDLPPFEIELFSCTVTTLLLVRLLFFFQGSTSIVKLAHAVLEAYYRGD